MQNLLLPLMRLRSGFERPARDAQVVGQASSARPSGRLGSALKELTDADLATAATACRAMAYQEGKRAQAMENPTTRGPIEAASQRY